MQKSLNVFISYSHKDGALCEELEVHLSNLKRQNIISFWYDGDIVPGTAWEAQILEHLKTAQIVLLLVSADFIASDFCYSIEMKQAIARHDAGEARIIPILLRPTDWKGAPFARLKMLPTDAKAVTRWPTHDDAFEDIMKGIRKAINELTSKPLAHLFSSSTPKQEPLIAVLPRQGTTEVSPTLGVTEGRAIPTNPLPNSRLSIILWIGVALLLAIAILGTYAIVTKQSTVISVISFGLALLAIPIGILQVAPNLLSRAWRTIKIGLLVLGISLLVVSLIMNTYLLIRPSVSGTPNANTPSPSGPTPTITSTPTHTLLSVPTLVQKSILIQSQNTRSNAVAFRSSVTAGNLIIVAITHFQGPASSVTDNHSNNYIQVTVARHANTSSDYVELYYAKNVTGGVTTVTSTAGGNVGIYEYSGLDITSPLDQVVSNAGYGDATNGGALNTIQDNELYFAVGVDDNGNNSVPSVGNGYTLEDHQDDSTHHERFYAEDRISAHGSYQTNFSIAAASNWAVIGASFKPAGILTPTVTTTSTLISSFQNLITVLTNTQIGVFFIALTSRIYQITFAGSVHYFTLCVR